MAGPHVPPGRTDKQFNAVEVFTLWSSEDLRRKRENQIYLLNSTFPYLALGALASSQVTQGFQLPKAQLGASQEGTGTCVCVRERGIERERRQGGRERKGRE